MNIVTISGDKVGSIQEALAAIRTPLNLPDEWTAERVYGFLAAITEPTTVVVTDLATMQKNLGKPARDMEDALQFAEEQNSRYLSVLFVD